MNKEQNMNKEQELIEAVKLLENIFKIFCGNIDSEKCLKKLHPLMEDTEKFLEEHKVYHECNRQNQIPN